MTPADSFSHAHGVFTLTPPNAGVTLTFSQVTRKDGLSGTLQVTTSHTFVQAVEGCAWRGKVNLLAPSTVKQVIDALNRAFDVPTEDRALPWRLWLTELELRTTLVLTFGPPPLLASEQPAPPPVSYTRLPGGLVVLDKLPMAICGDGEVGKSTLAAWMSGHLTAMGHRVLYLDWEEGPDDFLDKLHRLFPGAVPEVYYHCAKLYGPIWDQRDALVQQVKLLGISYVILDSVAAAIAGSEGGPESAGNVTRYFAEVAALAARGAQGSCSLMHVNKGVAEDEHKTRKVVNPFGSIFWKNLVRLGYFADTDDEGLGSTRTVALYRNKLNRLAKLRVPHCALDFTYDDSVENGVITVTPGVLTEHPEFTKRLTLQSRVYGVVARRGLSSAADVRDALAPDDETTGPTLDTVAATLRKLVQRGQLVRFDAGGGRGHESRFGVAERQHRDAS